MTDWIFQGNRGQEDLEAALAASPVRSWRTPRYRDRTAAGDRVWVQLCDGAAAPAVPVSGAAGLSGLRQCRRRLELRAQSQPGAPGARLLARKVQHRDDLVQQPGPGLPGDDIVGFGEAGWVAG